MTKSIKKYDALILGAGAAGLMTAAAAGQRGARVLVVDHAQEAGRKILISGGGRCNFTNLEAQAGRFYSQNPHFARSALARFGPQDFLKLVEKHHIAWHEKEEGQLFCTESARDIVSLLKAECALASRFSGCVDFAFGQYGSRVEHHGASFSLITEKTVFHADALVLATGGLSIPKLGASDLSLRLARQFGLGIVPPVPALVPLIVPELPKGIFSVEESPAGLAGVSLTVKASLTPPSSKTTGQKKSSKGLSFTGGMVFTHRGVSGPAILQISSCLPEDFRASGQQICLDLLPHYATEAEVLTAFDRIRRERPKAHGPALLQTVSDAMPQRFARYLAQSCLDQRPLAEQPLKMLRQCAQTLRGWKLTPTGTEGYAKAEVMRGGIDTNALSSQTMEAKTIKGLYAVGEAVDVTGWLGGYNFQWAWASGVAAGQAIAGRKSGI